jgi:K+-transporting ATPase KdpF subunit
VSGENLVGLIVAVVVAAYLLYALLAPERLG